MRARCWPHRSNMNIGLLNLVRSWVSWVFVVAVLLAVGLIVNELTRNPTLVILQWGQTRLSTSAPVAIMLGLVAAIGVAWLGRVWGWLMALPQLVRSGWQNARTTHTHQHQETAVLMAVAAWVLHSPLRHETLKNLPAGPLKSLLTAHTEQSLTPHQQAQLHQWLANPRKPFPSLSPGPDEQTTA